jgi:hypothetical protein
MGIQVSGMRVKLTRLAAAMTVIGVTLVPIAGSIHVAAGAKAVRPRHPRHLIPLYDDGNPTNWARACSQANGSGDGSWIIADVAKGDGAGSAPVPSWVEVIDDCYQDAKASVIGYVWTDYGRGGQASLAAIKAGIDNWYKFYPGDIAGIFFDGVSDTVPGTTTSNRGFYQTLATYVHTGHGNNNEVVFNFGANPGSDWMLNASARKNADIVVTFEGSYDTPDMNPYTAWTQPAWELRYPADNFAAIVYNAPDTSATPQPSSACARLTRQHVGYVYVGTWYDQLPYFAGVC